MKEPPPAEEPRADRTYGTGKDLRRLGVGEVSHIDQHKRQAKLLGKLFQGVADLCIQLLGQDGALRPGIFRRRLLPIVARLVFAPGLIFHGDPALGFAIAVGEKIVKNLRQPGFQMRPEDKLPVSGERPRVGLLHQVLRLVRLLRKMKGNAVKMVEVLHRLVSKPFSQVLSLSGPGFAQHAAILIERSLVVQLVKRFYRPLSSPWAGESRGWGYVNLRLRLLEPSQLLQDLFVGRSLRVIDFDEFPADHALLVDHVRRGMRPASAVGI